MVDTPSFGEIGSEQPELIALLKKYHPIEAAAAFSGLLLAPKLQAWCLRAQVLVHLALLHGADDARPTLDELQWAAEQVGARWCGTAEDPVENLFAGTVGTDEGNFRVLLGIREGTDFYLQRVLNVVETMPAEDPFVGLRRSVGALLKLSDAVLGRAGVGEYVMGADEPPSGLAGVVTDSLPSALVFSEAELERIGISADDLAPFVSTARPGAEERLGGSELERSPVRLQDGRATLLVPTAVATSITGLVLAFVSALDQLEVFRSQLKAESLRVLTTGSPLRGHGYSRAPEAHELSAFDLRTSATQIDAGHHLVMAFLFDRLSNVDAEGLYGTNYSAADSKAVSEHLSALLASLSATAGFKDGMCLIVPCGVGRGAYLELQGVARDGWWVESIGAHDLDTMWRTPRFELQSLWHLMRLKSALTAGGVEFVSLGGLSNFYAWARVSGSHLVEEGDFPPVDGPDSVTIICPVPRAPMRSWRREVALANARRRVRAPDGSWIKMSQFGAEWDEGGDSLVAFVSEAEIRKARLRVAVPGARRTWWVELRTKPDDPAAWAYRHFEMLHIWLRRIAAAMESTEDLAPAGLVCYEVEFERPPGEHVGPPLDSLEQVCAAIRVETRSSATICVRVGVAFQRALRCSDNVAERALVHSMVQGATAYLEAAVDPVQVADAVCPEGSARHLHTFETYSFRAHESTWSRRHPTFVDDSAHLEGKLGLGWDAQTGKRSSTIEGVTGCTRLLNRVVELLLDRVCEGLGRLDRSTTLEWLIGNYESAAIVRERWRSTAHAHVAMRSDRGAAVARIAEFTNRLDTVTFASRVLAEASLCECPAVGGEQPSEIVMGGLMAKLFLAVQYAGWSDAVHYEAMKPLMKITPLGDLQMAQEFSENVYEPFSNSQVRLSVDHRISAFRSDYGAPKVVEARDLLDNDFLKAWEQELGVEFDSLRLLCDRFDERAIDAQTSIIWLRTSQIESLLLECSDLEGAAAHQVVDGLTLKRRRRWREGADGTRMQDWAPWRYRRKLSVLRRPFLQIDDGSNDPLLAVAPGVVREALVVMARVYHDGELHPQEPQSRAMQSWIGRRNDHEGVAFNGMVCTRLRELGWHAEADKQVKAALGLGTDPVFGRLERFGDVDVLAWDPPSARVLVVECKDLRTQRTMSEIVRELAEFRGADRYDGKPDRLKKHLERLEVIRANSARITKRLGLEKPASIEGHLVFRHPVPLAYAWESMADKTALSLFDDLDELRP